MLAILLPTSFFTSLNRSLLSTSVDGEAALTGTLVNDKTRNKLLHMSRGIAIVLLLV